MHDVQLKEQEMKSEYQTKFLSLDKREKGMKERLQAEADAAVRAKAQQLAATLSDAKAEAIVKNEMKVYKDKLNAELAASAAAAAKVQGLHNE